MSFTLKKHEILRSKKKIQELFDNGSSFFLYPFKVYFLPESNLKTNGVLFSVSKKHFKRAVDRNLIRRRMREAYRLNKSILKENQKDSSSISMAIIYISKFKLPFNEIEFKLKQVFVRLNKTDNQN
ncbi:MAG: ribonuclease P protein component [Cyclobacteriaceae bacterium]|nr:ribonuclease P protein component [Cyclobacteriaceae bacterium]MCK5279879.1 ribonuclease P protein component [Cyclobacteriaceae bacterium]